MLTGDRRLVPVNAGSMMNSGSDGMAYSSPLSVSSTERDARNRCATHPTGTAITRLSTMGGAERVRELTLAHLTLSAPPIVLSLVIAVPVGWVAHRFRASRSVLLTLSGLLYAIPSLPLFIMLPALTGTSLRSPVNIVIALTLYGIALMVRTATDAFDSVPTGVRQSATSVGFSAGSRLWRVELPLAGPVLLSGLRVVVVSTVSLVTIGAVIGSR